MVSPTKYAQKFITTAMEREYCPCSRDYNILADVYAHRRAGHSTTGVLFSQVLPTCMHVVRSFSVRLPRHRFRLAQIAFCAVFKLNHNLLQCGIQKERSDANPIMLSAHVLSSRRYTYKLAPRGVKVNAMVEKNHFLIIRFLAHFLIFCDYSQSGTRWGKKNTIEIPP